MLKSSGLKPTVSGGSAVEEIFGVLPLVMNAGSTTGRSKSLSSSTVHLLLQLQSDRKFLETEEVRKNVKMKI